MQSRETLPERYREKMDDMIALSRLKRGEVAQIEKISSRCRDRRRLRELGLTDGAQIECVLRRRGIGAYLVRGTVLALRDDDSAAVMTKRLPHAACRGERSCAVWL